MDNSLQIMENLAHITRFLAPRNNLCCMMAYWIRQFCTPKLNKNSWTVIHDYDGNLKFKLDRSTHLGSCIYWMGYHHMRELRFLNKILQPDYVFADIGASIGEFTLFAAKRLSKGRVLAFEPVIPIIKQLKENIELNKFHNVTVYELGLSHIQGKGEVYGPISERTSNKINNEGLFSMFQKEGHSQIGTVKLELFDEVLKASGLKRLDFIKIDVEGSELPVLKGAKNSLMQYKPIILLEIEESNFSAAGYTTKDVLSFLSNLSYKFFEIKPSGNIFPLIFSSLPASCNIICKSIDK